MFHLETALLYCGLLPSEGAVRNKSIGSHCLHPNAARILHQYVALGMSTEPMDSFEELDDRVIACLESNRDSIGVSLDLQEDDFIVLQPAEVRPMSLMQEECHPWLQHVTMASAEEVMSFENVTKLRLTALAEVVAVLGARHRRSDRKFAGIYDSAAKSILAEAGNSNGKIVGVEQFLQLTTMGATGAYVAAPPPKPAKETPSRGQDRVEQETQRDLWLQTVVSITQCFAPQIIEWWMATRFPRVRGA